MHVKNSMHWLKFNAFLNTSKKNRLPLKRNFIYKNYLCHPLNEVQEITFTIFLKLFSDISCHQRQSIICIIYLLTSKIANKLRASHNFFREQSFKKSKCKHYNSIDRQLQMPANLCINIVKGTVSSLGFFLT